MIEPSVNQKETELIAKAYQDLHDYVLECIQHNDQLMKSLGATAETDIFFMLEGCQLEGKMEIVDKPTGRNQDEAVGMFTETYVDQWSVGDSGDSFEGYIYAKISEGKWLKMKYSC